MPTMTEPRELFVHELRDVYYAEQQLVQKLPVLIREAGDRELASGLRKHLAETKSHVRNLEKVFGQLGERARGERCPGIEGISAEHDRFMRAEKPAAAVRDLFLTGAAARAEHYEIAAYTGLIAMARGLGERSCVELLDANLKQEKQTLKLVESIGRRMARDQRQQANGSPRANGKATRKSAGAARATAAPARTAAAPSTAAAGRGR